MKVDFSKMLRTNLASDRSFELKLVGGQLPFAPPGNAGKRLRAKKKATADKAPEEKVQEADKNAEAEQGMLRRAAATSRPWGSGADRGGPAQSAEAPATQPAEKDQAEGDVKEADGLDFVPNMSGKFEFTLHLEDKEDWGKVFIYKILEAGIDLRGLDPRYVVVTDKRGRSTSRNREEMREMMEVARSYPIKVTYNPPDFLHPIRWTGGERAEWELQSLLMYYIKASITGPGAVVMDDIKYRHHRCVFERYQLYVAEQEMWNTDKPLNEEEFYAKFPELAPMVSLAIKVGPRLRDIFRGKEEILNMLFGG